MKNISLALLVLCGFIGQVTTLSAAAKGEALVEKNEDAINPYKALYERGYEDQKEDVSEEIIAPFDYFYKQGKADALAKRAMIFTEELRAKAQVFIARESQDPKKRVIKKEQPTYFQWVCANSKQIAGGVAGALVGWQIVSHADRFVSPRTVVAVGTMAAYPAIRLVRDSLTPLVGASDEERTKENLAAAGVGAALLLAAAYGNDHVSFGSYAPAVAKATFVAGSAYCGTQLVRK